MHTHTCIHSHTMLASIQLLLLVHSCSARNSCCFSFLHCYLQVPPELCELLHVQLLSCMHMNTCICSITLHRSLLLKVIPTWASERSKLHSSPELQLGSREYHQPGLALASRNTHWLSFFTGHFVLEHILKWISVQHTSSSAGEIHISTTTLTDKVLRGHD